MSLQDKIAQVFEDWGSDLNLAERNALANKACRYSLGDWKAEHVAMVVGSGALTGAMGGPLAFAAILPDLVWCKKVGTQGCLGIGHVKGCSVDYDQDMNLIMANWTGTGEVMFSVPVGKVGIKISNKALPKVAGKVAGKIVEKAVLKGGSKIGAKLASKAASKAATKLVAKLAAKTGVGWIPLIGGVVSAGINWWLIGGLMDAAEEYYNGYYLVLNDDEVSSLA